MSKRKIEDDQGVPAFQLKKVRDEEGFGDGRGKAEKESWFKEKHSLDSDEEEEGPKYDMLDEDDIEGNYLDPLIS